VLASTEHRRRSHLLLLPEARFLAMQALGKHLFDVRGRKRQKRRVHLYVVVPACQQVDKHQSCKVESDVHTRSPAAGSSPGSPFESVFVDDRWINVAVLKFEKSTSKILAVLRIKPFIFNHYITHPASSDGGPSRTTGLHRPHAVSYAMRF